jgi:hypothetical protein
VVTAHVAIAEVVREDENDIGFGSELRRVRGEQGGERSEQQGGEESKEGFPVSHLGMIFRSCFV